MLVASMRQMSGFMIAGFLRLRTTFALSLHRDNQRRLSLRARNASIQAEIRG
ncbi:hypothetical protein GMW39_10360 [Pectobacterium parmentieri]|uniref:hypothetical protein n=1 Tax=Pectobacterium parmentieri TaxID=1905730 RepID=UPI00137431C1|nr:hypothetical protein [Pectobacterium parmentieri]QHQ16231.1 hypothetical protein GMW39_10360 [Pectobacterium parmentieri]